LDTTKPLNTPFRISAFFALIIFVSEFLTMWLLHFFSHNRDMDMQPQYLEMFADSLILTILILPALYLFIYRPLSRRIIELNNSEDSLRKSEEKFRVSFEESNIGMCMVDAKGKFIRINRLLSEMFGYGQDELMEKTFLDITHPDDIEIGMELFKKMLSGESSNIRFTKRYIRKNGEIIFCNVSASTVRNSDDELQFIIAQLMDITEHREAEDKINKSQKLFSSIFHSSPIPIAITRAVDGRIAMINKAYEELFKCASDDVVGRTTLEVGFLKDDGTRTKILAALNTDTQVVSDEANIHDINGNLLNCLLSVEKIDYQGEDHILAMVVDISELKKAEDKLRENEEFTKAVLDNLPVGIAVNSVDPTVDFDYMNDNFPDFYRTTRDELAESDVFWDAVYEDPEFREEIKKKVLNDCASGDPEKMHWKEVPITRKGKETTYVTAQNIPIHENKLMISTVWDVTERKMAENELKEREFWLSESQKAASIGTYDFDITSGKWTCTRVLDYIFGIDEDYDKSVDGWVNIIHPEHQQIMSEYLRYIISNIESFDKEYKIIRISDGQVRWVYGRGKLILENNVPTRMIGTIQDITERKQASLLIETSLKEKEVLLREVHHRVKNNMAVISSLLSLQSNYIDDKKYLDMFKESQSRIRSMALVHEKLYQSDDFAHIDVQDYVKSLAGHVRSSFTSGGRDVKLNINVNEISLGIDNLVPCGLLINEILVNSFKHAFKGQDNPEITVTMTRLEDGNISLSISDNGIGLPDGYDISKSTGLGLKLIEPLTGQIEGKMEVKVEEGTEFRFVFPEKIKIARTD
jgi:PAS domain S-box-containing protein